jgi:protein-tyrosine-phosphatase
MKSSFKAESSPDTAIKKVLFVCVHNSGRSQMAEALFNHYAAGRARASSAGTRPASHTDRNVVQAMKEIGIDFSAHRPKMLTAEMIEGADRVVTMGCGVEGVCPAAFVPTEDWELEDPEGKPIEKVREIRDEVEARVKRLVEEIDTK